MAQKPRVYLAGQIQHLDNNGRDWRNQIQSITTPFECVNPLDKYDSEVDEYQEWADEDVVQMDLDLIDDCDAMIVRWFNVASCGTPMEIRYAYMHRIPVVVWTDERELSPWLTYHSDSISRSLGETCIRIKQILGL